MDEYLNANKTLWDAWTPYHVGSQFYDVEGFKAGRETLDPIELAGSGEVLGKSLHCICNTISGWIPFPGRDGAPLLRALILPRRGSALREIV